MKTADLSTICDEWRVISFSGARDTPETVSEVRENNAARNAFCARGGGAAIGAALPKDLTPRERLMTFFVGFMAAMVFGEPLREILSMSDSWAFGMAGILAMTGRNLAVFVLRMSRDPVGSAAKLLNLWRGDKGE